MQIEILNKTFKVGENPYTLVIYPKYILLRTWLTQDESTQAIIRGGINDERHRLSNKVEQIFGSNKGFYKVFYDDDESIKYLSDKGIPYPNKGAWSNTIYFEYEHLSDEESIIDILGFIIRCIIEYGNGGGDFRIDWSEDLLNNLDLNVENIFNGKRIETRDINDGLLNYSFKRIYYWFEMEPKYEQKLLLVNDTEVLIFGIGNFNIGEIKLIDDFRTISEIVSRYNHRCIFFPGLPGEIIQGFGKKIGIKGWIFKDFIVNQIRMSMELLLFNLYEKITKPQNS